MRAMAIRVVESKPPAELDPMAQLKDLNKPAALQPEHVWDQLTSLQQRQVMCSLVQVGRHLVQQCIRKEVSDEHD
jgi:hypothetical protein